MQIVLKVTDEGLADGAEFVDWLKAEMAAGVPVVVKWDKGSYVIDAEVVSVA